MLYLFANLVAECCFLYKVQVAGIFGSRISSVPCVFVTHMYHYTLRLMASDYHLANDICCLLLIVLLTVIYFLLHCTLTERRSLGCINNILTSQARDHCSCILLLTLDSCDFYDPFCSIRLLANSW